jgi:hypothetical protein
MGLMFIRSSEAQPFLCLPIDEKRNGKLQKQWKATTSTRTGAARSVFDRAPFNLCNGGRLDRSGLGIGPMQLQEQWMAWPDPAENIFFPALLGVQKDL